MRRWVARRLRRLAHRLDPYPIYPRFEVDAAPMTTTTGQNVTIRWKEG